MFTFDDLWGDFWPDEESVQDFVAAVRQWANPGEALAWLVGTLKQ